MKPSFARATLALAAALLASQAHASPATYRLVDLGTFSDGTRVNAHRQVAGEYGLEPAVYASGSWHLLAATGGLAVGLDNSGNAVGNVDGESGLTVPYYWPASGGQEQILPPPADRYFTPVAADMSGDGTVVGALGDGFGRTDCFLWRTGASHVRPLAIGQTCQPHAIANGRLFVGTGAPAADVYLQAFLWDGTDFRWLATLGGVMSNAYGVNKAGTVVGDARLPGEPGGNVSIHAVSWADASSPAVDLGTLPGKDWSQANAINSSGVIVGTASDIGRYENLAFVYSDGVMTDLNTLVAHADGMVLTMAQDINDKGVIVGLGMKKNFLHTFMLVPITQ
jgi:probable HAF family extracellular repeat protein